MGLGLYVALAGVLLGGCAGYGWCRGEIKPRPGVNQGEDVVYNINDEAYQILQGVVGIREDRIKLIRAESGTMFFSGDPIVPREGFYAAFQEADVDKNGIVDTEEAENLFKKVLLEKFPKVK